MSNKNSQFTMTISATDRASSAFRQVAQSSKALGQELSGLDKMLDGLGGALGGALGGGDLIAAAGGVLGGISLGSSLQEFGSFEKALWENTKVTDQAIDDIKRKIMEMPAALGSYTELATGNYQIISAGITDAVKANEMLVVASQTAKAAGVEQATAVNALAKVMNAYGHDVLDAATAANMFFTTEKLGMTNVRELAPLMGDLAGMAKSLGVEYYDLAGSMALITQTSGSASEASTRLRALMDALAKPSKELQEAYDAAGIVSFESLLQKEGWAGALRKIEEGAQKAGKTLAQTFSSQEAYQGFLKLMKDNFNVLQAFGEEIKNTDDALDNAFSGYTKIREAQYATLASNLTNVSIRAGENFRGFESSGLEALNSGLEVLGENFDAVADATVIFGAALTSLTAAKKLAGLQLSALGAQYSTFGGVVMQTSTTMGRVATLARGAGASLLSAFGGPVGVAVTALGAGMAYLATRESEAERAARLLDEAQRGVATALDASAKAAKGFSGELGEAAKLQMELAEQKAVEAVSSQWKAAKKELEDYVKGVSDITETGEFVPDKQLLLYIDRIEQLKNQYEQGTVTSEEYKNAVALFIKQLDAGDVAAQGFAKQLRGMFSSGFFNSIDKAITNLWDLARARNAASADFMGPLPETPQTEEQKPRTFGGGGSSEAKRKAEEAAKALEALNEKYNQLTMTERAFDESQLTKWIKEQLVLLPAYEEKILATAAAQRKVWADEDDKEAKEKLKENLETQSDFYEKLIELGGEYAGTLQWQNRAIAEQIEVWRGAGIPEQYLGQMERLMQLEISTDWTAGLERGFLKLGHDAEDMASVMESAVTQSAQISSSALANFALEGKGNFSDLTNSILNDMARMAVEMASNYFIKQIFNGIGGLFGGTSSIAMPTASSSTTGGILSFLESTIAHTGGIVGASNLPTRLASPYIFSDAPRYHDGGIAGNEVAAILEEGEGVFTSEQMRHLAPLDHILKNLPSARGGAIINVNPTVVDRTQKGVAVTSEQSTDSMGNMKLTYFIDEIDSALAGKVNAGRSSLGSALQKSYGLSRGSQAFRK